jgi:hypothetical protein
VRSPKNAADIMAATKVIAAMRRSHFDSRCFGFVVTGHPIGARWLRCCGPLSACLP